RATEIWVELAKVQIRTGNSAAARSSLDKALELSQGKHRAALVMRGRLDISAGDPGIAGERAAQLQKHSPKDPYGYLLQGEVLMASGQPQEAIAAYKKAQELGDSTEVTIKLYSAYRSMEEDTQGIELLKNRLKDNPRDQGARLALATGHQETGKLDAAMTEYRKILDVNPNNPVALNNLAWLYHERNDKKALEIAELAHQAAPENGPILDTVGWLRFHNGKLEQALKALEKAVDKTPDNPEIRYHLAAALAKAGDKSQAKAALETALKGNPPQSAWVKEAKALLEELK
ncbi:MAG: tetratricopeptide repeat protein, partial [Gammaproteobacteria bacterium]|nr:tetratricopeptide repeat protein [Gammaproteobacteria bacterium]